MKEPHHSYYEQGEKNYGGAWTWRPYDRRAKEDTLLIEASFEPMNKGDLWRKNGLFYVREAALQKVSRKLHESGKADVFDGT